MNKSIPIKVITKICRWYSMGYTPSFSYCPNCKKQIGGTVYQTRKCPYCGQAVYFYGEQQ